MKTNITLIGMPSAGKSMIGVRLAKELGLQFLDVDLLIQQIEGKLLKEILDEKGVDGFAEIEERINCSVNPEKTVIAPGGSVIYGKKAMEHLRSISHVVYLKISYEEAAERLGDLHERGVALRDGMTLKDLYEERIPLYEQYADLIVDEEGLSMGQIVDTIRDKMLQILYK